MCSSDLDAKRYLRNAPVAHPELQKDATGKDQPPDPQSVVLGDGIAVDLVVEPGKRMKVAPPAEKDFWIRQADTSTGAITVSIPDLDGKDVRLVIVRTDGKAEIAADAVATVNVPFIRTVGFGVLAGGIVLLILGIGLILLIDRRGEHHRSADAPPPSEPSAPGVDAA